MATVTYLHDWEVEVLAPPLDPAGSPHDPQQTSLHRVVREHLETFLERRSEAGEPMPGFVVDELRGYLRAEPPCADRSGLIPSSG